MNAMTWRLIALQLLIMLAVAFGALAWIQRPEGSLIWTIGMVSMPLAWLALIVFGAMPGEGRPGERQKVYNSLIGAALMITGALGACALGTLGAIEEESITRYGMIVMALALIICGNGLPKKADRECGTTRGLAIRRLLGWTFVVAGFVLILAWLTLPMAQDIVWWATFGIYTAAGVVCAVGTWRIAKRSSAEATF